MTVYVLGLDGATWDLLDPLMDAGQMPRLRQLVQQGVRERLLSTFPPVTALAWPTFYTGQNAGKHGVFSFVRIDAQGRERVVDARSVRAPALWDYASAAGMKVGVVGVPITYPARPVNGFLISDFLTPPGAADACAPAGLLADLEWRCGRWTFHIPPLEGAVTPQATSRFVADLMAATERRQAALRHLLDTHRPDLFINVWMNTDTIQHGFWGYLHPQHPLHHAPEAAALRELVWPAFRQLDACIGELAERVLPDGNLLLMSDHGFGGIGRRLALNNVLAGAGLLSLRSGRLLASRVQRRLRRWLRQPVLSEQDELRHVKRKQEQEGYIDWGRTQAFSGALHEMCIHLHRSDRYPRGAVSPAQVDAVAARVCAALLGARSPDGSALIAAVHRPSELFHGPHVGDAPDLFVQPADPADIVTDGLLRGGRLFRWEGDRAGGWHRRDGIFLAAGKGIGAAARLVATPGLLDLAPTILRLLGLQPPAHLDGRTLTELLAQPDAPASFIPALAWPEGGKGELSDAEEMALNERLRGLGYL